LNLGFALSDNPKFQSPLAIQYISIEITGLRHPLHPLGNNNGNELLEHRV